MTSRVDTGRSNGRRSHSRRESSPSSDGHPGSLLTALLAVRPKSKSTLKDEGFRFGWILHPAVDLLFVCGGVAWALFALHYFVAKPLMSEPLLQVLAFAVLIGAHLLSETHTVATLVRAYGDREERRRLSLYTEWGGLACLTLLFAGLFIKGFTPVMAKIYLLWVVQHFTAQSYGLALLYCLKRGYALHRSEKLILQGVFASTAIYAIVRQLVFKDWSPNGFLAQLIPFWGPLPPWCMTLSILLLASSAVLCLLMLVRKYIAEKKTPPLPVVLILATTVLMYTFDHNESVIVWLYIPAFFHGSQYVVISLAHYTKQRGFPEAMKADQIGKLALQSDGLKYLGFLVMGAIVLYIGVPRVLTEFGFNYTHAFATVFCAINLHHFLTDGAIWKLRDPKLRRELVDLA